MRRISRLRTVLSLAFISVAVLPVLLVGFLSVNLLGERLERGIREKNQLLARMASEEVNGFLSQPIFVLNHLRSEIATAAADSETLSQALQSVVDSSEIFESISLVDDRGVVQGVGLSRRFQADLRDYQGLDLSGQPFFSATQLSEGDSLAPYWSDVFASNLTGQPSVTLSIVVPQGRLVGTFSLQKIRRVVQRLKIRSEVSTHLLDRRGIRIFSQDADSISHASLRHLEVVKLGMRGREGTFRYDMQGREMLGSIVNIPETGWMLLVSQAAETAFEPVAQLRLSVLVGTSVALLLALFLAYLGARKVLRPIFRLTEQANRIAQGEYQVELPGQPFSEMEVFVRAFRQMVQAIRDREDSLRRSEKRYRVLFDSGNDIIFVYPVPRADEPVTFFEVNDAACKRLGFSREELLKMSPQEILPTPLGAEVRQSGRRSLVFETELCGPHHDRFPVEVNAHLFELGGELMVLEICRDIGERRQQQKMLADVMAQMRSSNEKLDGILRSVPGALVVTDAGGHVMMVNEQAEEIFGIRQSGVADLPVGAVMPDKRLGDALMTSLKFNLEEHSFDFELPAPESARSKVLRGRTTLIRNESGEATGMVAILLDVTHEREVERMKSEFVTTAAHELRTPLTTIQGFTELLLTQERFEEEQRRTFLSHIHTKSLALGEILSNLLDLSRIESGMGLTIDKKVFPVEPLLRKMAALYEDATGAHHFEVSVEGEGLVLYGDEGKMEQVLENLLSNAVKYSPQGGTILLAAVQQEGACMVTISDEGIGMSAEEAGQCFEKFYRADASNAAVEGTGLGMSIVKAIVDSHGGSIRIESAPGAGTAVSLSLPVPPSHVAAFSRRAG